MDAATKPEASGLHSALRHKFMAIVGNENVHAATAADAVAGVQPKLVIEPGAERELAEILRLSNEAGLAVIPRGNGTKLGWGNPPTRADLILSTTRLNEIIEHAWADLTVTSKRAVPFKDCRKHWRNMGNAWRSIHCGQKKRRLAECYRRMTAERSDCVLA